jgi:selenocysteine-specific elongation factor
MHVIATAGHVDHGKSTLVRLLTGMEPDRWAEERRRGLTIDLGFAWTDLPSGVTVAFVDVPGHERFVPNMLAGVGSVPAVLFVVAADGGWMPQSAEHLAALDALGVRHAVLAVTRADLADPAPAAARARAELAATSLGDVPAVAVNGRTGEGLDDLRAALDTLVGGLLPAKQDAPVRLWVDRSFTIRGSGTVVTGTLGAGRIRAGDALTLRGRTVHVRGLQALGRAVSEAGAVARVAVNLRGVDRHDVGRGDVLVTPDLFHLTDLLDVRLHTARHNDDALPAQALLHLGSAAVAARIRPIGADTARLRLDRALPLHVGDRALLRDPGRHRIVGGVTVLDVAPPPLRRRGAAAARAAVLAGLDGVPDERGELRRRGPVRRETLIRMGVPVSTAPVAGDWVADPATWAALRERLAATVDAYTAEHPVDPAVPIEVLRRALRLPDRVLVEALVAAPLVAVDGRVGRAPAQDGLPAAVASAAARVAADLATAPFRAPDANRLAALGLGRREIAAVARVGLLLRVGEDVLLRPDAPDAALATLRRLPQPFTLSQARQALHTTRRVAVPLLEYLARLGATLRHPDGRHSVVSAP